MSASALLHSSSLNVAGLKALVGPYMQLCVLQETAAQKMCTALNGVTSLQQLKERVDAGKALHVARPHASYVYMPCCWPKFALLECQNTILKSVIVMHSMVANMSCLVALHSRLRPSLLHWIQSMEQERSACADVLLQCNSFTATLPCYHCKAMAVGVIPLLP